MRRSGQLALLALLVALPYLASIPQEFVYDDHGSIAENAYLRDPAHLRDTLLFRTVTDPSVPDGRRPVVVVSYFADLALWGPRPAGFHATNLALHLAAVFLLLRLAERLSASRFGAMAAALVFGLHPALIEAVHVPAFREDLCFTLFVLLYLLLGRARGAVSWLSIPALVLALGSKEAAVAAPVLLAWTWFCVPDPGRPRTMRAAQLGLGALIAAGFFGLWAGSGALQGTAIEQTGYSLAPPASLLTAPWLWLLALRLLLLPYPLLADYVIDPVPGLADSRFLFGLAAAVLCAALAAMLRRRSPRVALGVGWMLIAFLPVSNLVPLYNPFAERYLYSIAAGFALAVAGMLDALPHPRFRAAVLAALCAQYAGLASLRLSDWQDDLTLWSRTLAAEPRSVRARTWIGLEYKRAGEREEAARLFRSADRINPQDVSALINLGVMYGEAGRFEEAEAAFREAIRRRPRKADAHWNLAVALLAQGRTNEAAAAAQRTLELDPYHRAALPALRGWGPSD